MHFSFRTPVSQDSSSNFKKLFLEISTISKSEHMNYHTLFSHSHTLSLFFLWSWGWYLFGRLVLDGSNVASFWEEYEFIQNQDLSHDGSYVSHNNLTEFWDSQSRMAEQKETLHFISGQSSLVILQMWRQYSHGLSACPWSQNQLVAGWDIFSSLTRALTFQFMKNVDLIL